MAFYEQIGDDTRAPLLTPQQPGETIEELLDRFWREALATYRGFPDRAVLFHAACVGNPIP